MLNYILYEHVLSLLSILAWRGSYVLLDVFLYPKDAHISAGLSLALGYPLYFLLMYTQSYSHSVCSLTFFNLVNCSTIIQNVRHLAAFVTCVLLWRGFWLLFDADIATLTLAKNTPYLFYIICMLLSFGLLSLLQTASSINGPMSHMFDRYDLFPHYPNCYLLELFNIGRISNEISSNTSQTNDLKPYTVAFC
jgi:hypothetical protein